MPVRDATHADLPEILAMVQELAAYEREPHAAVFDPGVFAVHLFGDDAVARALIAESPDGVVAGFAVWFRTFSTWLGASGIWLEDLFVRPEFRGGSGSVANCSRRCGPAPPVAWNGPSSIGTRPRRSSTDRSARRRRTSGRRGGGPPCVTPRPGPR